MMRTVTVALAACCGIFAQSFEVASIKQHIPPVSGIGITNSGVRVTVTAVTLSNLVWYAYDLKDYQVSGGPKWANDDRWDILAKGAGETAITRAQAKKMMQTLLAERFHLTFHREKKVMSVYTLGVSKNGVKLKENNDPNAVFSMSLSASQAILVTATKGTMDRLTDWLSSHMGQPVIDLTGLTGVYDYKLEWLPDHTTADSDAPSIFTAVQEQLGLKLESTKRPVEVLVVDSAERPSAN